MRKKKAQRVHCRRRFFERYGMNMTNALHDQFVKTIQSGEARFIRKSSLRVSIFGIDHDGREIIVAYDKHRKQLASTLPEGSEDESEEMKGELTTYG